MSDATDVNRVKLCESDILESKKINQSKLNDLQERYNIEKKNLDQQQKETKILENKLKDQQKLYNQVSNYYETHCGDNPNIRQRFVRHISKYMPTQVYNSTSLQKARGIAEKQGKKLDLIKYVDLKKGVIYYVVVPLDERNDEKRHIQEVAFVKLSEKQAETTDGTKTFNIYDDDGKLKYSVEPGYAQSPGDSWVIMTVPLPESYFFVNADNLLSSQVGGNKRKKHSSNKLSKRRVKTKSRRRNNLSHRRKQQR